jgi:hypothetical protein
VAEDQVGLAPILYALLWALPIWLVEVFELSISKPGNIQMSSNYRQDFDDVGEFVVDAEKAAIEIEFCLRGEVSPLSGKHLKFSREDIKTYLSEVMVALRKIKDWESDFENRHGSGLITKAFQYRQELSEEEFYQLRAIGMVNISGSKSEYEIYKENGPECLPIL